VGSEAPELVDFLGHLIDLNSRHTAQKVTAQIITYQKLHSEAWLGVPKNGSFNTL
jgi:hypothetical protein